jgi:ParB-like chromosome segregation protein Spo0J
MKPTVIEPMAVTRLRSFPGNPRTHSKKQIRQIADSIARFGFTNPMLIGEDNEVIAGHGRLEAAKLLGRESVPTLRLSGLDAEERRAYALADNKLALNARWDRGALAVELKALADVQFDAEVTGFSCAEIELVLEGAPENCRRASEAAVCSPSPASGGGRRRRAARGGDPAR